jgi:hypothetical protein
MDDLADNRSNRDRPAGVAVVRTLAIRSTLLILLLRPVLGLPPPTTGFFHETCLIRASLKQRQAGFDGRTNNRPETPAHGSLDVKTSLIRIAALLHISLSG